MDCVDTSPDTTLLRSIGGWTPVELGFLRVVGSDAQRFLQAQTTNDVSELQSGNSQLSCLTDRKSHPLGCFHLYRQDDGFAIICKSDQLSAIHQHLNKFIFADKVELEQVPKKRFLAIQGLKARVIVLATGQDLLSTDIFDKDYQSITVNQLTLEMYRLSLTGDEGFVIAVKEDSEKSFQTICDLFSREASRLQMEELSMSALEIARIEAGMAELGKDFSTENLLSETPLADKAVSYTKGCFQGQEVIARVKNQGSPSRALTGAFLTPPPAVPFSLDTPILCGDETIGWIKSNGFSQFLKKYICLAMVKRDFRTPGKTWSVSIGGSDFSLIVDLLPFYKPRSPLEEAVRLYEEALERFAVEDDSLSADDSDSIRLLREALVLHPRMEDGYEALGVILSRRNKLDEAIELMEFLAELNPDSVMAHTNLSVFYLEKGWKEKAEEEKAVSMSIRMRLAMRDMSKNEEEEEQRRLLEEETRTRMSMFEQVLEIDPEDQLANYGLGDCLVALGQFRDAVPRLHKSIEVKPSHSVSYLVLGRAYEGLDQNADARTIYQRGIEAAAKRGDGEPLQKMRERLANLH